MKPEQARHLLAILRYYLRESSNVLADPRDFPPEQVETARQTVQQLENIKNEENNRT